MIVVATARAQAPSAAEGTTSQPTPGASSTAPPKKERQDATAPQDPKQPPGDSSSDPSTAAATKEESKETTSDSSSPKTEGPAPSTEDESMRAASTTEGLQATPEPQPEPGTDSKSTEATTPAAAPSVEAAAASPATAPPTTTNTRQSPHFLFLPRLGLTIGGWTHLQDTCDAKGSLSCGEFDVGDHSEASGLGVFMDGLVEILPPLRVGLSAGWVPSAKGDAGTDLRRLGMEFSLQGVLEGALPLSPEVALTGRVSGGAAVLLTKGFSEDQIDQAIADCDAAIEGGVTCFVDHNTPFSPVFGAGFGFLWRTTGVRLDFQYQMQKFTLYKQEASVDSSSIDAKVALQQSRFWLLGGVEF